MKKLLALAALLSLPLAAQAAEKEPKLTMNADKIFEKSDVNQDGVVSKDEYTSEKMKEFAQYDKNKDNQLSKIEHEQLAMEENRELMGKDEMGTTHKTS
jgi:hypothetical protein